MKDFGILGGGIAGLSLSYFLGQSSEVLEKESECGGLCRSFEKDGFTYDLGGHILFSRDDEILDFELSLLKDRVNKLFRNASCWYQGRHVKYPFENGISVLDREDIYDCLYNFLDNPRRPQNNFEDWLYNTFGRGFCDRYMIPYNEKIWKVPPSQMGTHWVERIPKPPAKDIVRSALGIETEGYLSQLYFYYPKTGGFQTLPRTFEELIEGRITRNFKVKSVRRTAQGWAVSNDLETREYRRLINTMPIHDFIKILDDVPPEVGRATDALLYNSLVVVMIGLNRTRAENKVATYFPQKEIIFHRLVFFDYFGKNYVPEGCSSMVAEITSRPDSHPWTMTNEAIVQEVINGLEREGFIRKSEVVTSAVKRRKYGYVLYDLHREKNLDVINEYFREQGIELCGRFGEFKYMNSDAVIRSAKTVSQRLLEAREGRSS